MKVLEEKIEVISKEKEEAIYNQEFEKAASLRDAENEARGKYEREISTNM